MARHSGISKESFYRYFRGKEELFTAVLDQELSGYQRSITAITEHWDEEDMRETLRKVAHTLLTVLMSDRQRALRQLVFNEVRRNPEIGAHYYRIGPTVAYDSLEAYFSLHAGETDFEPRFLARAFLALLLHDLTLARNCGVRGQLDAKEMAARVNAVVDPFIQAYFRKQT